MSTTDKLKIIFLMTVFVAAVVFAYKIVIDTATGNKKDNANEELFSQNTGPSDTRAVQTSFLSDFIKLATGKGKKSTSTQETNLQQTTKTKLTRISQSGVIAYGIIYSEDDEQTVAVLYQNGHMYFYQITPDKIKNKKVLNSTIDTKKAKFIGKQYLARLYYSDSPTLAITQFPSKDKKQLALLKNINSFTTSEDGVYYASDSGVYFFDIKNSTTTKLALIPFSQIELEYNDGTLVFYNKPSKESDSVLFVYNSKQSQFTPVLFDKRFLLARLLDSDKVLIFELKDKKPISYIYHLSTDTKTKLPKPVLPNKCDFDEGLLYCFIPDALSTPLDYILGKTRTKDTLYSINPETQMMETIFPTLKDAYTDIDADSVIIESNKIYFINKYDGAVYKIDLE